MTLDWVNICIAHRRDLKGQWREHEEPFDPFYVSTNAILRTYTLLPACSHPWKLIIRGQGYIDHNITYLPCMYIYTICDLTSALCLSDTTRSNSIRGFRESTESTVDIVSKDWSSSKWFFTVVNTYTNSIITKKSRMFVLYIYPRSRVSLLVRHYAGVTQVQMKARMWSWVSMFHITVVDANPNNLCAVDTMRPSFASLVWWNTALLVLHRCQIQRIKLRFEGNSFRKHCDCQYCLMRVRRSYDHLVS